MMIALGEMEEVFGGYSPLSEMGVTIVNPPKPYTATSALMASEAKAQAANTASTCANDVSLWRVMMDAASGKCFNICEKEGIVFEVDPAECKGLLPGQSKPAATRTTQNWASSQSIIQGVPNWLVLLGAFAVIGIVMNN